MRTNLGKKMPFLPLPVVVIGTYDKTGKPNAMTAAWSTIYDYDQVFVSMGKHKTCTNLKANKAFTLAFATKETAQIADYFGLISGSKQNKIAKAKVHVVKAAKVNAPIFCEFPLVLECKVNSFKEGNLVGDIVNVNIDNKYLSGKKILIDKMNILCYDMSDHSYRIIGKKTAKAFEIGKQLINKK